MIKVNDLKKEIKRTKEVVEKQIESLNELYRSKALAHRLYLIQIIPLLEEYLKTEISLGEKIKVRTLLVTLKGIRFVL